MTAAIDVFSSFVHLRADGTVDVGSRRDPGEPGRWTMAGFHAEDNRAVHADIWERHPLGDEILCMLAGSMSVYLRDGGPEPVANLTPGACFVVPAGQWHRLTVQEPCDLLSITPREQTQHEHR